MAFLPRTTLNSIRVFVPSFLLAILLYLGKSLTMEHIKYSLKEFLFNNKKKLAKWKRQNVIH